MKSLRLLFFLILVLIACGAAAQTHKSRTDGAATAGRAQQLPNDIARLPDWPTVGVGGLGGHEGLGITNDGKYVMYYIFRDTTKTYSELDTTLVVQGTKSNWKTEIAGGHEGKFAANSRTAVFIKGKDSLCTLKVEESTPECIQDVNGFELVTQGSNEWLVYQISASKELVLRDLTSGKRLSFANVAGHVFSKNGNTLVLARSTDKSSNTSVSWVNLPEGEAKTIWEGAKADSFVLNTEGTELAFKVDTRAGDQSSNAFWHYKQGDDKPALLVDDQLSGIDSGLRLGGIERFSRDGKRLFITLAEVDPPKPKPDAVKVDIWSYKDVKLQSDQLREAGEQRRYKAVLSISDHHIVRLEQKNERTSGLGSSGGNDDVALVVHIAGNEMLGAEWNWNPQGRKSYYLVSVRTGERKRLPLDNCWSADLSADGKYVIGHTYGDADFYAYEVSTGVVRNITKTFKAPVGSVEGPGWAMNDRPELEKSKGLSIGNWFADDSGILLYDEYDIWRLDPSGKTPPINLTNGYGRKHEVTFRPSRLYDRRALDDNELILTGFNNTNMDSGFYRIRVDQPSRDPELLTMGSYHYATLVKALDTEMYLVARENATESPNLFWSTDLRSFHAISDVHPERAYNWLTATLVSFKTVDGRTEKGILYKPENFDPATKYPVILNYYEKRSSELNHYRPPNEETDFINPSWFVSNGYLVFIPDIHYKIGHPGQGAYDSIVGAARYLSSLPYVDSKHMGLQGHSWSGFETNYMVTHSKLFAAAVSSSGVSDAISGYGTVTEAEGSQQGWYEYHQVRIGATPWQRLDLFIENSPALRSDRVATPLLLVANKGDSRVPFSQGVEFFVSLRRLGKPVWMLQYDGENHGVGGVARIDYRTRMKQFFDYYLKGAPPAKWMTEGVPAKLKGIETGLELDTSGAKPEPLKIGPPAIFDPLAGRQLTKNQLAKQKQQPTNNSEGR